MDPPAQPATTASTAITQGGSQFGPTEVLGGLLLQGNFAGLTINPPASARADYAGHYSHTSPHPIRAYVDRPALCDQIREQLDRAGQREGTRILAVWGLGGAGKTQLVLDYLRRHRAYHLTTLSSKSQEFKDRGKDKCKILN